MILFLHSKERSRLTSGAMGQWRIQEFRKGGPERGIEM